jgi:hypothetical protein
MASPRWTNLSNESYALTEQIFVRRIASWNHMDTLWKDVTQQFDTLAKIAKKRALNKWRSQTLFQVLP